MVIGVVVAVAIMVSTVVVTAVPGCVSVVRPAVVYNRAAVPAAIPTAESPTATAAAHQRAHRNPSSETNDPSGGYVAGGIAGNNIRVAINQCGVVLRDVHNLGIGWLDDNHLR